MSSLLSVLGIVYLLTLIHDYMLDRAFENYNDREKQSDRS